MANRAWHWDQPTIRLGLAVALRRPARACSSFARVRRAPRAVRRCSPSRVTRRLDARGRDHELARLGDPVARRYAGQLPQPLDWVDRATDGAGVTYLGQDISLRRDARPRAHRVLEPLDQARLVARRHRAAARGPTLTPDLERRVTARSRSDPGLQYVARRQTASTSSARPSRTRRALTLTRIDHHPWRLQQTVLQRVERRLDPASTRRRRLGRFAYFGPERKPGTLDGATSAAPGFCAARAPSDAPSTVRIGPLGARRAARRRTSPDAQRADRSCSRTARRAPIQRHRDAAGRGRRCTSRRSCRPSDYGLRRRPAPRRSGQLRVQPEALTSSGKRTRVSRRAPGSGSSAYRAACSGRGSDGALRHEERAQLDALPAGARAGRRRRRGRS